MNRMKRKFFAFILLLSAGLSLSSCLNSNDDYEVTYTHDTAITAFSLGDMKRYYEAKSTSTGNDTTYSADVTGASYKFVINQTTREIYNVDSLPVGTNLKAVLASMSSKNSSPILLMDTVKVDSAVAYYSSSDSINFSVPRQFRVYNNDFSAYATYTVKVNVHQEEADSFKWHSLATQNAELAALTDLKALPVNHEIFVFGKTSNDLKIYKSANGITWTAVVPNVAFQKDAYQGIVAKGGVLYAINNGVVLKSSDAANWETVATDASLKQLIGASTQYLYAYTATGISVSKDNGASWEAESLDTGVAYLPTQSLNMGVMGIRSTKNAENLLLLGMRDATQKDTIATVWTHTVDYNTDSEAGMWNYVEYDARQHGKLPYLDEIQVAANDSGYIALGSNAKLYKSIDAGLTWMEDTTVALPSLVNFAKRFAFCRDDNNFYWLINGGNVWKGRFNRDGWRKE